MEKGKEEGWTTTVYEWVGVLLTRVDARAYVCVSESGGASNLTMPVLIYSNIVQGSRKVCVEFGILLSKLFMISTWFSFPIR